MTLTALDYPPAKNEINILLLSAFRMALARFTILVSNFIQLCFLKRFLHLLHFWLLHKPSRLQNGELSLSIKS
jgi:hypothetical protein